MDDIHRRCQDKSLRDFVVKKSCLRNLRNQRLIKPVLIWVICDSITKHLFEKTNPIFPRFEPKNHDSAKSKPNSKPIKPNSNPILSQLRVLSVLCGEKQYLFMQNEPKLPRFQPKNRDFTKKQTQNKPKTNPNKAKLQNTQNEPILCIDKAL